MYIFHVQFTRGNAKTQSRKVFRNLKDMTRENFASLCLRVYFFMLLAEEQHHDLGCKDAEEHTQWINRRVADRRRILRA